MSIDWLLPIRFENSVSCHLVHGPPDDIRLFRKDITRWIECEFFPMPGVTKGDPVKLRYGVREDGKSFRKGFSVVNQA